MQDGTEVVEVDAPAPRTPAPAPSARLSRTGRAVAVAGGAAAVGGVAVVDPHVPGTYPVCPSLSLFGVFCPLCGGLRATHALATGDLGGAIAMNPAVPLLAAAVLGLVAWRAWARRRGRPVAQVLSPRATAWTLAALAVFGVLRNVPVAPFAWLAPG